MTIWVLAAYFIASGKIQVTPVAFGSLDECMNAMKPVQAMATAAGIDTSMTCQSVLIDSN